MDRSDPKLSTAPVSARKMPGILRAYGLVFIGALVFAAWLYGHLGDFTAERGWRAALQVTAISLAFGAMAQLVVEAAIRAVQGLQNDLDVLTAGRERRSDPDDGV
jgi:hypothetical protein